VAYYSQAQKYALFHAKTIPITPIYKSTLTIGTGKEGAQKQLKKKKSRRD
jgi:hypothetical protein